MSEQSRSREILTKAEKIIPGGVNSPVRSFKSVGGNAFVASHGDGPYLIDVDGNKMIDLVCSWGALIHGHNHPAIRSAVEENLQKGTSFGITCEKEIELCELITKSVPGIDMVRLVNSGTEACMSAIRLARGATQRDIIIKFDGNYHGHADSFLVGAGSGVATLQVAGSAGVTQKVLQDTIVLPFNDVLALEKTFANFGNKIAGVILEVVCGNIGVVLPELSFLQTLRRLCTENKSILIFDEVMTGFRLSLSGAQGIYGIKPDLITLGKIIGGGMPVGAYGGREDLMKNIAPLGSVYQAGTLSGNPLCSAAGVASLQLILKNEKDFYQNLDANASEWKSQLDAHIESQGYEACVVQMGSMVSVFFCKSAPKNYAEVKLSDTNRFNRFFWSLMKKNIYYPPSAFEACFLSSAHDEKIMEELIGKSIEAIDEAFHG
ncbi:MAG: glutamate-1-semialdehyde 2,1-aminomutase [Deltaproteobacteria bacterium]|nr:glutamate-1-semialdehyde 2,1-aminomutase [Deltaproteobacteria bacterium]